jgi:tRNA wybutosine-synthesizing protein 1
MDVLAEKSSRTVLRTTLLNGINMHRPAWYAGLSDRADPDFIELKAYMHVGHSRDRLGRDTMPEHDAVVEFAEQVQSYLPEFSVLKDVSMSRVALLAKTEDTWVPALKDGSDFWDSPA